MNRAPAPGAGPWGSQGPSREKCCWQGTPELSAVRGNPRQDAVWRRGGVQEDTRLFGEEKGLAEACGGPSQSQHRLRLEFWGL